MLHLGFEIYNSQFVEGVQRATIYLPFEILRRLVIPNCTINGYKRWLTEMAAWYEYEHISNTISALDSVVDYQFITLIRWVELLRHYL